MTAPDSWLRVHVETDFPLRLTGSCNSPKKLLPLPQNRVLHNGLQGLTFDEFILHNEKLDHCGTEQSIGPLQSQGRGRRARGHCSTPTLRTPFANI